MHDPLKDDQSLNKALETIQEEILKEAERMIKENPYNFSYLSLLIGSGLRKVYDLGQSTQDKDLYRRQLKNILRKR